MTEAKGALLIGTLSLGLTGLFLQQIAVHHRNPYSPMAASLNTPETDLQDVAGIALGVRRLAADLAWVQTLQYYGTQEPGQTESEFENGIGHYPRFLDLCRHVSGLDPYFTYVYYYGGAVLGWNLNRLDEAEVLLKEGIARNPTEWRLPQYLAGLAYQKNHDVAKLVVFLESVADDPQCPLLMKALLANLYKKERLYDKALRLWESIYASGDPNYRRRAIDQTRDIVRLQRAFRP